jgi:protease-4
MVWLLKRKNRKQIARLEIKGPIAQATRNRVLDVLKQVEDRQFPALLLRIDSPGGTVSDSHEIYCALKRLQPKLPIVASFGNISASGGVYISMGAQHIMANPGTITGSIGVILRGNNLEKLLDKVGVSFKVIKSGPYKDILSFDRELTAPEQEILQDLINASYQHFVQIVAENRQMSVEQVKAFADGRIFTGEQALALGTVDRLGTEEDARCWAAELAGLDPDKTRVYTFSEPKSWLSRFTNTDRVSQCLASNPALASGLDWLEFELTTSGTPLWLYRP